MSDLHYELNRDYGSYGFVCSTILQNNKRNFLFDVIVKDKIILSGTHLVIGSFDTEKNIFIWADNSNTLDKIMVDKIHSVRIELSDSKDKSHEELRQVTSKDQMVMTSNKFNQILTTISQILGKQVLINNTDYRILHVHVVDRIFYDNRKTKT